MFSYFDFNRLVDRLSVSESEIEITVILFSDSIWDIREKWKNSETFLREIGLWKYERLIFKILGFHSYFGFNSKEGERPLIITWKQVTVVAWLLVVMLVLWSHVIIFFWYRIITWKHVTVVAWLLAVMLVLWSHVIIHFIFHLSCL